LKKYSHSNSRIALERATYPGEGQHPGKPETGNVSLSSERADEMVVLMPEGILDFYRVGHDKRYIRD